MFNVVNIIPTGIGANIGGFAGDANPINTVLENLCDNVITHPNTVNAASLYVATKKTLYVEGYSLDQFIKGEWGLKHSFGNKIGIIIDKKAKPKIVHIVNAINACISVFGTEIVGYTLTKKEVGAKVIKTKNDLFEGIIENKETLYESAQKLISLGANAIAVFTVLDNPYKEAEEIYMNGAGIDPIGKLEAMISHIIVEKTMLPSAHAPVFLDDYERFIVDPRVSAEEIGYTYIPCVIRGLQSAPQLINLEKSNIEIKKDCLTIKNVNAILCPISCLDGVWLQEGLKRNIPIISVKENTTFLSDTPKKLGLEEKIIIAENYLEAIGVLISIKSGVSYKALRRPLNPVKEI